MSEQAPRNAIAELLTKPDNVALACEIYKAFPEALAWLGKVRLLRILRRKCEERLRARHGWCVQLEPDVGKLLNDDWPGVSIEPKQSASEGFWHFWFEMRAKQIPFTFSHGICWSQEDGGRPTFMSPLLQSETKEVERQLESVGLKIRPWPDTSWFACTEKPYRGIRLGDKPQILTKVSSGILAEEIADEFFQLFENWSAKIERLNALADNETANPAR